MSIPARLNQYLVTEKQRHFPKHFLNGWQSYETCEEATVGASGPAQPTFKIVDQDIVEYNKACGESDSPMIDAAYAREHSPTGEVLQYPIFVTAIAFDALGESGIGTPMRTPGAGNPNQYIESFEPFRSRETITTTVTTADQFVQRNKPYLRMQLDFHNQVGIPF